MVHRELQLLPMVGCDVLLDSFRERAADLL